MKNYFSAHLVPYEQPQRIGFCCLPVLPFLIGHGWDQLALDFVHSLKPSYIRVTRDYETLDAVLGRVTIHVDDLATIKSIEQEVEVGLDGDYGPYGAYSMQREARRRGIKCE